MKIAPLAEVKTHFSTYVEDCKDAPVVVTKNGRPAAVLIAAPEDDEELERLLLAGSPRFQRLIDDAMGHVARGQGLSHEDVWNAAAQGAAPKKVPAPAKRAPRRRKTG